MNNAGIPLIATSPYEYRNVRDISRVIAPKEGGLLNSKINPNKSTIYFHPGDNHEHVSEPSATYNIPLKDMVQKIGFVIDA